MYPCPPAPPIESMVKFCDILSMGGAAAAAGADKGTIWLDLLQKQYNRTLQ